MYLLDVNVLLAFWYCDHTAHLKVTQWIRDVEFLNPGIELFKTCSIVELGFIRVASGPAGFAETVEGARSDLREAKAALGAALLSDEVEGDRQPTWVTKSRQTTDGHLLELAGQHKMRLATLDRGIPGAVVIPIHTSEVREPTYARYLEMTTEDPPENLIYDENEVPVPGYPYPRWMIDPETGYPCVRSRLGVPKITSEEVREMLKDFP